MRRGRWRVGRDPRWRCGCCCLSWTAVSLSHPAPEDRDRGGKVGGRVERSRSWRGVDEQRRGWKQMIKALRRSISLPVYLLRLASRSILLPARLPAPDPAATLRAQRAATRRAPLRCGRRRWRLEWPPMWPRPAGSSQRSTALPAAGRSYPLASSWSSDSEPDENDL